MEATFSYSSQHWLYRRHQLSSPSYHCQEPIYRYKGSGMNIPLHNTNLLRSLIYYYIWLSLVIKWCRSWSGSGIRSRFARCWSVWTILLWSFQSIPSKSFVLPFYHFVKRLFVYGWFTMLERRMGLHSLVYILLLFVFKSYYIPSSTLPEISH